jgi:hypothetical protein
MPPSSGLKMKGFCYIYKSTRRYYLKTDIDIFTTSHISCKSKAVLLRHAGAKGERKYSSYSFLTSALDGVSGQSYAPTAAYRREKNSRYPLDRRLGGPQSWSGHSGPQSWSGHTG